MYLLLVLFPQASECLLSHVVGLQRELEELESVVDSQASVMATVDASDPGSRVKHMDGKFLTHTSNIVSSLHVKGVLFEFFCYPVASPNDGHPMVGTKVKTVLILKQSSHRK